MVFAQADCEHEGMAISVEPRTDLRTYVREFLETTHLPITELGRRAERGGKPMSPNTIRSVLEGGPYSAETEQRLRQAIAEFVIDVSAFSGEHGEPDQDETVARLADRRRRRSDD